MSRLLLIRFRENLKSWTVRVTTAGYFKDHPNSSCFCCVLVYKLSRLDLICKNMDSDPSNAITILSNGYIYGPIYKKIIDSDYYHSMILPDLYCSNLLLTNSLENLQIDVFYRYLNIDYYNKYRFSRYMSNLQNRILILGLKLSHKKYISKLEKDNSRVLSKYIRDFNKV